MDTPRPRPIPERFTATLRDLRAATGDPTYYLDCDNDTVRLLRCGVHGAHPISPRLTVPEMDLYLMGFDRGLHTGLLAAKRGR
jgi:hypothetical protein